MNLQSNLLTLYSDIQAKPVQWLWRPYIPIGKVTLLQGDPNDGKSTMIRPCENDNPNSIRWGRLREERWIVSTMGCKGLSRTLFSLMNWKDEGKYKFRGQFITQGDQKILVFRLDEPVITKKMEQIVIPGQSDGFVNIAMFTGPLSEEEIATKPQTLNEYGV